MGILSPNFSNNHKLINFNVPKYLIKNFDTLVKFKRVSRTSMLIQLMETYIRTEQQRLKEDNSLNHLISDITIRNRKEMKEDMRKMRNEWEPPMIPKINDRSWDDYLKDTHQKEDWTDISGIGFLDRLGR